MKKYLLILLAALVLFTTACGSNKTAGDNVSAEIEEETYELMPEEELPLALRLPGDWYAGYGGLVLNLRLSEDGSYTLRIPGQDDKTGTWALSEGYLVLDGNEDDAIMPMNGRLCWQSTNLVLSREAPDTYVPAGINTQAQLGDMDGYWMSHFVAVGDGTMLSSELGENTDIYIKGSRVALGGPLFGDIIVDADFNGGVLTYEAEGISVTLGLQDDGLLRMTMTGSEPVTVYLMPEESAI